ncbi:MAG TPA: OsmC family protein [Streptosporangiaceae bacterium]|nr:OsmC family protein [Streptosporangiaceae bacterium]
MDSETLRAAQQPLKESYREDPAAALVTLRADGDLDDSGLTCSVSTGQALVQAGLHPASGGDGLSACSGDMLLQALVACAGVTLRAVATSLGVPVSGGRVSAEGEVDFRGTLAVDREAPVGFTSVRLSFNLDTSATPEQLDTLLRLTERYCVVYQTLASPVPVTASVTSGAVPGG